jgi:hypothetical protein
MSEYIPDDIEISDEMIEAGVTALQRRGIGMDEPMFILRDAVRIVFEEMADVSRLSRKTEAR